MNTQNGLVETLSVKLHRMMCTQANRDYLGSITIDQNWLDAAGLFEGIKVDVANITNGERLSTYCINGERGSGVVCLNGAAAHKFNPGDLIIVIAYIALPIAEAKTYKPRILLFNNLSEDQYTYDKELDAILYNKGILPSYKILEKEKHGYADFELTV